MKRIQHFIILFVKLSKYPYSLARGAWNECLDLIIDRSCALLSPKCTSAEVIKGYTPDMGLVDIWLINESNSEG